MSFHPEGPCTRQRPRTCVACRIEAPKRALVRIVRTPAGEAVLDVTGRLPGRGAYLCLNRECLRKARKTGALARALRTALSDTCWEELERCIVDYAAGRSAGERERELRSLLGLSRRSGMLIIGTDNIRSNRSRPLFLLMACDASEPVLRFADDLVSSSQGHARAFLPFDIEALSGTLGAVKVQIVAIQAHGGLADKIRVLLGEGRCALEQQDTSL